MFSSAELIQALLSRGRPRLWFRAEDDTPPGEFPAAWKAWFATMTARDGAITGASRDAMVAVLLQRALAAPPRRVGELNRWRAFATLWRQQWQPPAPEDRTARIAAYAITFVLHLLLLLILLWLASVRIASTSAPEGDEVVQVEYIGTGTPEDTGGGPPSGEPEQPAAAASAAASAAPASASASPATGTVETPPSPASQPPTQPQPPAAAQPLQVTEVAVPDAPFVLAPPNPQAIDLPKPVLENPQLQSPTQVVDIVETQPAVQAMTPQLPQIPITVPQLRQQPAEVTLREAPKQLPHVQAQTLPERPIQAPAQSLPNVREIPMPAAAAATASATTPARGQAPAAKPSQGNAPTAAASKPGGSPATSSGTEPGTTASGSGKTPGARPGAFPTPQRGDDWGASTRNRPGGNTGKQPGLFNADGSPRLPPGVRPTPGGGSPPGTIQQDIADLARSGTWLRRAPRDFEPTSFDKYWAPNETLLAEWVRRNIREVSIPIPGTSKKLRCVVSLLQLGGGCGITDPNMQDQEAVARPSPDIPFKPELQEDQDALRKPPGGR